MEYLDTNVFIRYFTRDDPAMGQRAYEVFRLLEEGALAATTCEGVIVEVVQVLSSRALYHFPREDIRVHLTNVLTLKGLRLPHKDVYVRALEMFATRPQLDFVDALQVAHMQQAGISTIVSFDKGFDKVPGITRREP